jgi:hypothetical protein
LLNYLLGVFPVFRLKLATNVSGSEAIKRLKIPDFIGNLRSLSYDGEI